MLCKDDKNEFIVVLFLKDIFKKIAADLRNKLDKEAFLNKPNG